MIFVEIPFFTEWTFHFWTNPQKTSEKRNMENPDLKWKVLYTRYNKALVRLQLSTVVQPLEVFMVVQYQIHLQGVAYRFHNLDKHYV